MDAEILQGTKIVDPQELGRRIRTIRVRRGMSQLDLAAGVASAGYVSRIESGQRRPEADVLVALAKKLEVSPRELLFGEAADPRAKVRLELDYAELEIGTGSAQLALVRLRGLPGPMDQDLRQLATLLEALALEATSGDSIPTLEKLVAEQLGSTDVWFRAHVALCRALRESGELDLSISRGEAALAKLEGLGLAGTVEAVQLAVTVAGVYELRGDVPRALRICRTAMEDAERIGSTRAQVSAYWNASVCESQAGNIPAALELTRRALELMSSDEDARAHALLRSNIGAFLLMLDPPEATEALDALEAAAAELASTGASSSEIARTLVARARALFFLGDLDQATAQVDKVVADALGLSPYVLADAYLLRGQILKSAGRPGVVEHYEQAVIHLSATGQDRAVAKLWYRIADAFEDAGDAAGALDAYRRAGVASGMTSAARARTTN